jgi:hypothetical protein
LDLTTGNWFPQTIKIIFGPKNCYFIVLGLIQICLIPRLAQAITLQNKGTSKIANIINRSWQHWHDAISNNWNYNKRIKETNRRIDALENSEDPADATKAEKLENLFKFSIPRFERRWLIGPN